MKNISRITFRNDTGEVRALLTPVTFKNFSELFQTEIAMMQGAGPTDRHGRREYVFTMPDDGRRELLMDFLEQADHFMRIEASPN